MQKKGERTLGGMRNVLFVFFCCRFFPEYPVWKKQVLTVEKEDSPMNIVIAVALLALLLVHIGEQSHRPAQRKTRANDQIVIPVSAFLRFFRLALFSLHTKQLVLPR